MSNYSKRLVCHTQSLKDAQHIMFLPVCILPYSMTNPWHQNFTPCWPAVTPYAMWCGRSSPTASYNFIHFKLTYNFKVFIFYYFSVP